MVHKSVATFVWRLLNYGVFNFLCFLKGEFNAIEENVYFSNIFKNGYGLLSCEKVCFLI